MVRAYHQIACLGRSEDVPKQASSSQDRPRHRSKRVNFPRSRHCLVSWVRIMRGGRVPEPALLVAGSIRSGQDRTVTRRCLRHATASISNGTCSTATEDAPWPEGTGYGVGRICLYVNSACGAYFENGPSQKNHDGPPWNTLEGDRTCCMLTRHVFKSHGLK